MKTVTIDGIEFEVQGPFRKLYNRFVFFPIANYLIPRPVMMHVLRRSKSRLIQASLKEAGSWQSMMVCYDNHKPNGLVDTWVQKFGAYPIGIRNRRKLCWKTLRRLLPELPDPLNIVAIGAGPGPNVLQPVSELNGAKDIHVYLIDLSSEAFEHGHEVANQLGLGDRVKFIQGNAVDVEKLIDVTPGLISMVGILEYLNDEQVMKIFRAMAHAMHGGGAVMASTLGRYHGLDRFLKRAFGFNLHYRDEAKVTDMLREAGFNDFQVDSEPMGIYDIVVGYRKK